MNLKLKLGNYLLIKEKNLTPANI